MTFELLPLIGVEGIVIFSLILLVSLGLAGFRLSVAGNNGQATSNEASGGRLRLRQRIAKRLAAPVSPTAIRSQSGQVAELAGWIFAAARNSAAKSSANQSKIAANRSISRGVKLGKVAEPVQSGDESEFVDDCRAGVAGNELQRMDPDTQWGRVNKIVTEGLGKAKEIEALHEAAARQLDAVDYAYERMLVELRDVLPGVVETRSVCRTNRDADYAAVGNDVDLSAVDELGHAAVPTSETDLVEPSSGANPMPAASPQSRGRKTKDRVPEQAASAAA